MVQNKKNGRQLCSTPGRPAVRLFLTCEQLKLHLAGV